MYEYPKITNVFKRNMDAPEVVAVEYLGTGEPTIASITIEPYKEITPIECIAKIAK